MSRFIVKGGSKLKGEISVEGSKNAILPILAATILNGKQSIIKNCPKLRDVEVMIEILNRIGCKAVMEGDVITVDSSNIKETLIPEDLAAEMRSSIIFMGPMLARCGKVTISYPGGCVCLLAVEKLAHIQLKRFTDLVKVEFHTTEDCLIGPIVLYFNPFTKQCIGGALRM